MARNDAKRELSSSTELDIEDMVQEMEPWESWETKLIWWSLIIGIIVLIIGGILTQILLL